MIKYKVKYCLRDDCRRVLTLDARYDTITEAIEASLKLEQDPEVYTSWHEQDLTDEHKADKISKAFPEV